MNSKVKGNKGENNFARYLRENGIKAFRDSASGGSVAKGDLHNNINATIEVKTVKKLNLMEAWKQVTNDAQKARNRPILAIHYDKMPKDEWLIVLHSNDWLDLEMDESEDIDIYQDPKKKYRLKNMIESAKAVLRDYEN